MSFSKSLKNKKDDETIEFKIVQDADRIDAIGAIAIARVFTFDGAYGRPLYDPNIQPINHTTSESYKNHANSSFNHFEEKLLHLKDLLNTDTAKGIAHDRHEFMEKYIEQFLAEWEGKK
jgi:uncharacterized protein